MKRPYFPRGGRERLRDPNIMLGRQKKSSSQRVEKVPCLAIGSFTVAIFELIFGFIFGSFSVLSRENDKNEIKND